MVGGGGTIIDNVRPKSVCSWNYANKVLQLEKGSYINISFQLLLHAQKVDSLPRLTFHGRLEALEGSRVVLPSVFKLFLLKKD